MCWWRWCVSYHCHGCVVLCCVCCVCCVVLWSVYGQVQRTGTGWRCGKCTRKGAGCWAVTTTPSSWPWPPCIIATLCCLWCWWVYCVDCMRYPGHDWKQCKWDDVMFQRKFMVALGKKLGITSTSTAMMDVKHLLTTPIQKSKNGAEWQCIKCAAMVALHYSTSTMALWPLLWLLCIVNMCWHVVSMALNVRSFNYKQGSKRYNSKWATIEAQRGYFDDLATKLGIRSTYHIFLRIDQTSTTRPGPEDWYSITKTQFQEYGGRGLLDRYNGSLRLACSYVYHSYYATPYTALVLLSVCWYPDYMWMSRPLEDKAFQKKILNNIAAKLHISGELHLVKVQHWTNATMIAGNTGWYKVPKKEVLKQGGAGLLKLYDNSLSRQAPNTLLNIIQVLMSSTLQGTC